MSTPENTAQAASKLFFGFLHLDDRKRAIAGAVFIILALGWVNYKDRQQINQQHENEIKRLTEQDIRKDKRIERLEQELIKIYDYRYNVYSKKIEQIDSTIQNIEK